MPSHPDQLLLRTFTTDLVFRESEIDGSPEADGLLVPFGEVADILEARPDGVIRYREQIVPGAFERAMKYPHRVTLTYNHSRAMSDRMGYGVSFREAAEGLFGTFRLDRSHADQAREILTSSHRSLSIGFVSIAPKAGSERPGQLVTRKAVHLDHVAAVTIGAYSGAVLSSVRADNSIELDPAPSAAELAEQERRQADADLLGQLDELAKEQQKWNALLATPSK